MSVMGKEEKGAEEVFVTDAGDFDLPVNQLVDGDLVEKPRSRRPSAIAKKAPPVLSPMHAYSSPEEAITAYA